MPFHTRMKPFVALLALVFSMAIPSRGQESGLAFLRIGTNAAALAMGDAQVAHSRDAFSTYWNPAGLAAAPSNTVAVAHHLWVGDVRTYALASRFRAGASGGVGFFVTATGSGDLEARDGPGEATGLFDAQFLSAGASYGRSLGPLRAGATLKFLTERIFTDQATGVAVDFGLQVDLLQNLLQLGAALQNVGEMSELNAQATRLPRLLRVGAAVFPFRILTLDDDAPVLNTFVTAEVLHSFTDESTQYHFGLSAEVMELVTVRAGYITNDALRDLSFGGGLRFGGMIFDYALLPFAEGFGGTGHILTLSYGW